MRSKLLEATVSCLVECGWAGTTTVEVSQRAGVSRGAQLHHFPSKKDLVVAAVEHVSKLRQQLMAQAASDLPTKGRTGRTRTVLAILVDHFTSDMFFAALEIWNAARTDEQLLELVAPLERDLGREAHRYAVEMFEIDESKGQNHRLVQATLDLLRGLGLAATLSDDTMRRDHILDAWANTLDRELVRDE